MCMTNSDGARHGDGFGVTDAEVPFNNAKFLRQPFSTAPKLDPWRTARLSMDDHI